MAMWSLLLLLVSNQLKLCFGLRSTPSAELQEVESHEEEDVFQLSYDSLHPWQQQWLQDVFPNEHPRQQQSVPQGDDDAAGSFTNLTEEWVLGPDGLLYPGGPQYPGYPGGAQYPGGARGGFQPLRSGGIGGIGMQPVGTGQTAQDHRAPAHPWTSGASNQKVVGEGTFGKVYVSQFACSVPPFTCAIKEPKKPMFGQEMAMVEQEFQIQEMMTDATGLAAGVLQTKKKDHRMYAILEAAGGGDMRKLVNVTWKNGMANEDGGKLAQVIFAQLTLAMKKMHELGVVHLDLKPENILVNKKECIDASTVNTAAAWIAYGCAIKITDFGLSCIQGKSCQAGMVGGTPPYMSPLQFVGVAREPAFDMWAVGVILYNILFNSSPYSRHTLGETAKNCNNCQNINPPTHYWTQWSRSNPTYWQAAKTVLQGTLHYNGGYSTRGRYTAEQCWSSAFVEPMKANAEEADTNEKSSPLRILPDCVRDLVETPQEPTTPPAPTLLRPITPAPTWPRPIVRPSTDLPYCRTYEGRPSNIVVLMCQTPGNRYTFAKDCAALCKRFGA